MRKLLLILTIGLSGSSLLAQEETIFLSADIAAVVGYTPWKSFNQFRKEYNTTNEESLKNNLGGLSDQYGYNIGIDCFVSKHLYSTIDYSSTYGSATAKFDNGAKRLIKNNTRTITTNLGWLQSTNSGYWTLSAGFAFAFGNLRSFIEFADGTRYVHTGGLSGEFHDLNIGMSLKYEYSKKLTERLSWRSGVETLFFFETSDLGMQNAFVTQTAGNLSLNNKPVLFDVSGITFYTGLSYKLVKHE